MKKNRLWQVIMLLILSLSIIGCNAQNVKHTNVEAISYLKDKVDKSDSIAIESIRWATDKEGRIYYLIAYDIENDSSEYLGFKNCIVLYNDSPDKMMPEEWYIYFESVDDRFPVAEAKYNIGLADEELESGELSSQEIDEILLELSSSK